MSQPYQFSDNLRLSLVCLVLVVGLSAIGLVVNLWLNLERDLSGNIAATIISGVALKKIAPDRLTTTKKYLLGFFSSVAGLSSLVFLAVLQSISPFLAGYEFLPLTFSEASVAFTVNGGAFFLTILFMEPKS